MSTKIVAGIAGTGILTSAGLGSYYYLTSQHTFQSLLKKEYPNKIALNKDSQNKEKWLEAWKSYVGAHSTEQMANSQDSWGLDKWNEISEKKDTVPDALAEECGKKINEKIDNKDNPIFKNFVNWCTVEKTA